MKWIIFTGTYRLTNSVNNNQDIIQSDYDARHNLEVAAADEVYAFQVNDSTGTQDTINKAEAAGLKISLHKKYTI